MAGIGDCLHSLMRDYTGEDVSASCRCRKWIKELNDHDGDWARANTDKILADVKIEAGQRAKSWKLMPVDPRGGVIRRALQYAWRGAWYVPGAGVLLETFIRAMIDKAIAMSEQET